MENNIIDNFKRLKDEMEQKGYSKEYQLNILVPLFENILNSMQDLLKSEQDKYDDFVAKFQFLRAVNQVDADDKDKFDKAERFTKNTLEFLAIKGKETADGLKEILEECTNED